jgi:tRNA threonylcarbamoyladenosine biosynthesis protein TsaE
LTYRTVHKFESANEAGTLEFAERWAASLSAGSVIAFYGPLGSGKTTFIRGLCIGLEVQEIISSPTFTLVNEYRGRLPVYHLDLYRISTLAGLKDVGLEDYFYSDGICLVEWPEIAQSLLPPHHQAVRISYDFSRWGVNGRLVEILEQYDSGH